jgi:outer membrane protein OmpA-like peptidoglycan-associated protein
MCSLGSSRRIWRAFFALLTSVAMAFAATVLAGCAAAPKQVVTDEAVGFEVAMEQIAKDLVQQLQDGTGIKAVIARIESQLRQTAIVIDPFIDAQNGYAVVAGKRAQTEIADKAKAVGKGFEFSDLTTDALAKSNFVMSGTIGFESKANTAKKLYRVHVALTNSKTGTVAAQSSAWLSDANIDMKPLPVYQESPVFLNDRYSRGLVQTSVAAVGQNAEATYFSQLATAALQAEAQQAYATDDTKTSLSLYQRAETRNDGKTLKIYSGLYVSHLKLGNLADAEKTFGQLVAVAFAENNLSIRFLFQVNSTDFINEPKLNQQYRIWVRQLGQHIIKSQQCVEVQGHSSKSGNEAYNNRLSLQRAEFIRRQMQLDSSASVNLTKATGRGFQDNLVGSGSDNEQDAIDRRVEFKIVPCSQNRGG